MNGFEHGCGDAPRDCRAVNGNKLMLLQLTGSALSRLFTLAIEPPQPRVEPPIIPADNPAESPPGRPGELPEDRPAEAPPEDLPGRPAETPPELPASAQRINRLRRAGDRLRQVTCSNAAVIRSE